MSRAPGPGASVQKVVVQLPAISKAPSVDTRHSFELEALVPSAELVEVAATSEEEFLAEAADAAAIITSWGFRISRSVVAGLDRCIVIGVGSVGVDMVDVEAATEAGIVVTNVPDVFIEEVADHTIALLLAGARRMREMDSMVRRGDWFEGRPLLNEVPRLWGQTLGLVSFGNVARAVARAGEALRHAGHRARPVRQRAEDDGRGRRAPSASASCSRGPTTCRCTRRSTRRPDTCSPPGNSRRSRRGPSWSTRAAARRSTKRP